MKKLIYIFLFSFFALFALAQSPQSFKYQGVARNSGGDILVNQSIGIQVGIRMSTPNSTIIYKENHSTGTNQFGLFDIEIGNGSVVTGNFQSIQWDRDDFFLSIYLDPNGGTNFQFMGTTQLLSVPYSLHSSTSSGLATMTSAERDNISSPAMGMQIFNTDSHKINYYDGYGWIEIHGVRQADFTCGNPLLDSRDGQYYNTVQIGSQCWMAENLNYGTMIDGSVNQSDNGIVEKYCYSNNENLCDNTYGGLYQWREMMQWENTPGAKGICPPDGGWHIPTQAEWNTLVSAAGGPSQAGTNLAVGGSTGFNALMGGWHTGTGSYPFFNVGSRAYFYNSTEVNTTIANYKYLINNDPQIYSDQVDKYHGLSVRCVRD